MTGVHEFSKTAPQVTLADGSLPSLQGMSRPELHRLQWEQEQRFAKAILASPRGSHQRKAVTAQAYDTICTLLGGVRGERAVPLVMGHDTRYVRLVVSLLDVQASRGGGHPGLFEIGYGAGTLLSEVVARGHMAGGIEVSASMRRQAIAVVGEQHAPKLLLGSFCELTGKDLPVAPTVIYWNDVLEHVAPDEASDYLEHAHRLLAPGGSLVTISPNWLLRPSDVTADFYPPRTTARGLHLKKYRLGEVTRLLRAAGFRRIATPLVAIPASSRWGRFVIAGDGGRLAKEVLEPAFEWLPIKLARILCRGLAMSCTVATKGRT
jgi:SAM-dependent methyltransferase